MRQHERRIAPHTSLGANQAKRHPVDPHFHVQPVRSPGCRRQANRQPERSRVGRHVDLPVAASRVLKRSPSSSSHADAPIAESANPSRGSAAHPRNGTDTTMHAAKAVVAQPSRRARRTSLALAAGASRGENCPVTAPSSSQKDADTSKMSSGWPDSQERTNARSPATAPAPAAAALPSRIARATRHAGRARIARNGTNPATPSSART